MGFPCKKTSFSILQWTKLACQSSFILSILTGSFSVKHKVIPLFKENYQPISLLSISYRTFAKLVSRLKLVGFFYKHALLSLSRYVYGSKAGTIHNKRHWSFILNHIYTNMGNPQNFIFTFLLITPT